MFMRILLQIIFLFFIFLIALEDFIRWFIGHIKTFSFELIKQYKIFSKKLLEGYIYIPFNLNPNFVFLISDFVHRFFSKRQKKHKRHQSSFMLPLWGKLKYFSLGILFSFFFLFLPIIGLIFLQDLPSPNELSLRQIPQTTKIFDRNGTLLAEIYTSQNRTLIPLSDVPKYFQEATLAIEDKNFYTHPGFDI